MGSIVQKTVQKMGNTGLRKFVLKLLFKKNGLTLNSFRNYNNKIYIYEVNNKFIPSETINWYISYKVMEANCQDISLFKYKPQKGDVIVDIGAGLGEEAMIISDIVGETGKVYSIEANPRVYSVLKEIITLNKCGNVQALNIAVNYEDVPVNITDTDESYKTGFVENKETQLSVEVEGLRFDSFIKKYNIKKIDLLKCNIEGAERFVVDSISKEYISRIRNVAIACHDFRYSENQNDFFVTRDYIKQFLLDNSFEIETRNTGIDCLDDWVYGRNTKNN